MVDYPILVSIFRFPELIQKITDSNLEKEWSRGSYKSEGVRFAFFRTYEELLQLAVELQQERIASGTQISQAQRVLAQYHSTYLDLQSVLLGLDSGYDEQPPMEGEWPLRRVIVRIIGADLGF